jgi:serine/threonine protein kinase
MDYKLIGEGAYGCVFKPSLPCSDNSIIDKGKISKFMLSSDALKEIEEYAIIAKLDPKGQYYTGSPRRCTIKNSPEVERAIKKCKIFKKKFNNKSMKQITNESSLLIIGDGGEDLEKWVKNVVKSKNVIEEVSIFWKEMIRLFKGLKAFKKYQIIHHDLKPQNVVYKTQTKRGNFIDFGLMRSIKSEASKCKEISGCKSSSHWNYPTGNIFMNRKKFDIISKQTLEEREITFVKHLKYIDTKVDIPFVNSFSIMKSYLFKSDDKYRQSLFEDNYLLEWKELLFSIKQDNYNTFLNKAFYGFDVFGFGFTLMYVLGRVKQFMDPLIVKRLDNLFFKMMTPNIFLQISIEESIIEYEEIIKYI